MNITLICVKNWVSCVQLCQLVPAEQHQIVVQKANSHVLQLLFWWIAGMSLKTLATGTDESGEERLFGAFCDVCCNFSNVSCLILETQLLWLTRVAVVYECFSLCSSELLYPPVLRGYYFWYNGNHYTQWTQKLYKAQIESVMDSPSSPEGGPFQWDFFSDSWSTNAATHCFSWKSLPPPTQTPHFVSCLGPPSCIYSALPSFS